MQYFSRYGEILHAASGVRVQFVSLLSWSARGGLIEDWDGKFKGMAAFEF
ncbi:hypothetical protein [Noviherbaspirillum aerium]|nr:hypothetical protein [Noviherbaspirillum aerium]